MVNYKFLVPLSVAVSAVAPAATAMVSHIPASSSESPVRKATDAVVREVAYQIGTDEHLLLMKRSDEGEIYAYHRSHRSHRSHNSHSSHRSSSH
ncbi:MAG: His-Xaa-Ser repeat protein HxsA2 [Pseudomonadota bacterium]